MKTTIARMGVTLALALVSAGCLEHTYNVGAGAPLGPKVYDEWHNHWLGGLIGERTLDVERHCPSGNATIHNEQSFLNGLVAALTSGIYTPTSVTIRCDDGEDADLELERGEVMTILGAPAFLHRVQEILPARLHEVDIAFRALQQDDQD